VPAQAFLVLGKSGFCYQRYLFWCIINFVAKSDIRPLGLSCSKAGAEWLQIFIFVRGGMKEMSTQEILTIGTTTALIGIGFTFVVLIMLMGVMMGMKLLNKKD
jgi:hypothetical protein